MFVYMIKNNFNKLYVGIIENLEKRLDYHNSNLGAKFTKGKEKFYLVFHEKYSSLKEARQREIQIKKWKRSKKEFLIEKFSLGLKTKI